MKDQVENAKIGLFRCTTTCPPQLKFVFDITLMLLQVQILIEVNMLLYNETILS